MSVTFDVARSEVADAGQSTGGENRSQLCGEDEAERTAPEEVDQRCRPSNVAAHHANGLAQGSLDGGQAMHDAVALGDATATRTVHANGVNLDEISHRAIALSDFALDQQIYETTHDVNSGVGLTKLPFASLWPTRSSPSRSAQVALPYGKPMAGSARANLKGKTNFGE
jgi:hypothetical protein